MEPTNEKPGKPDEATLTALDELAGTLAHIAVIDDVDDEHKTDEKYAVRYGLVFTALHQALNAGLVAGIRIDEAEPTWPVAYINLPTGQISWHQPQYESDYDGHTPGEKYDRIREFIAAVAKELDGGGVAPVDDVDKKRAGATGALRPKHAAFKTSGA